MSRIGILLLILTFSACQGFRWPAAAVSNNQTGATTTAIPAPAVVIPLVPGPPWAQTVTAGTSNTQFKSVAVDNSGNVYVVGYQDSVGLYDYGSGVTATGSCPGCSNSLIVKYSSTGTALWARTVTHTGGSPTSQFFGVATDSVGNVYAAGYQSDSATTYDYGSGITSIGVVAGTTAVVVKYDSNGTTLWALAPTGCAPTASIFTAIAIDSSDNIYIAGYQNDANICNYGAVPLAGFTTFNNPILLKVNSAGTPLWGRTNTTGGTGGQFNAVATDTTGNIFVAGGHNDNSSYTYGGVVVSGASPGGNVVLVKFDASGNGLWGKSTIGATNSSTFQALATDTAGNVYGVGYQFGVPPVNYGGGVSLTGLAPANNTIIVKYDSSGTPLWGKTTAAGASATQFNAVAVNTAGEVYAAGTQANAAVYNYGSGVTATGVYAAGNNACLVKYSSSGTALSARVPLAGAQITQYNGAAVIPSGNVYLAGIQNNNISYTYDAGVTAGSPVAATNAMVVKFSP